MLYPLPLSIILDKILMIMMQFDWRDAGLMLIEGAPIYQPK